MSSADNFVKIAHAQEAAPSYLHLLDDGADFKCEVCGECGRTGFVVTYTPDRKFHRASHLSCLDEDWVARAKDMGSL